MPKWRVLLNGQNFLMDVDGQLTKLGFYANRYVEAESSELAELAAVQCVREDETFDSVRNEKSDSPMIFAEEIEEIMPDSDETAGAGYTFYQDDADG